MLEKEWEKDILQFTTCYNAEKKLQSVATLSAPGQAFYQPKTFLILTSNAYTKCYTQNLKNVYSLRITSEKRPQLISPLLQAGDMKNIFYTTRTKRCFIYIYLPIHYYPCCLPNTL